jgi:hypothetical protein
MSGHAERAGEMAGDAVRRCLRRRVCRFDDVCGGIVRQRRRAARDVVRGFRVKQRFRRRAEQAQTYGGNCDGVHGPGTKQARHQIKLSRGPDVSQALDGPQPQLIKPQAPHGPSASALRVIRDGAAVRGPDELFREAVGEHTLHPLRREIEQPDAVTKDLEYDSPPVG